MGTHCLEGILPCPCHFLYPADSIGSLQGDFLRCPSLHLLLHLGCQSVGTYHSKLLLWLDTNLRRLGSHLDGTLLHGFWLRLHPRLLPDPDGFRLFLTDSILPCGPHSLIID